MVPFAQIEKIIEAKIVVVLTITTLILGWAINSNGTILTTASGVNSLEWVDFADTYGYSREYVETNLLGEGNPFEGYRYATRLETISLLNSYSTYNLTDIDDGWRKSSIETTNSFLMDFGATNSISFEYTPNSEYNFTQNTLDADIVEIDTIVQSMFLYGDSFMNPTSPDYLFSPFGSIQCAFLDGTPVAGHLHPQTTDLSYSGLPSIGLPSGTINCDVFSLLVRDTKTPVPEPTTMLLFATGIVALTRSLRKKEL